MTPIYHLPQVQYGTTEADAKPPRRGVGLPEGHAQPEDVLTLKCDWFYDWRCTPDYLSIPGYIPMSWGGHYTLPGLTPDFSGYLLALNEPDNAGQLNITASEAAARVITLQAVYPQARLIIGGVSAFGAGWLNAFITALGSFRPAGWAVHGYCEWGAEAGDVLQWFEYAREICHGGEFWVTEFADVDGGYQADNLIRMVSGAPWITRFAWFASRLDMADWYVPQHWSSPALIDGAGLTDLGRMYVGQEAA